MRTNPNEGERKKTFDEKNIGQIFGKVNEAAEIKTPDLFLKN